MFAANRNDKVIGRTKILVVSINTRKGFNHSGAPSGRKCAVDFFGEYLKEEISILNHIGRPIDSVNKRWLDDDREYGIMPIKLIIIIIINSLHTVLDSPLILIDDVRYICVIINSIIGMNMLDFRCDVFHILDWITRIIMIFIMTDIVTVGVIKLYLAGSKIEKISLIIKIWYDHLRLWRSLVYLT